LFTQRNTWKRRNSRTDIYTPTNISQKWAKITISVMECSDKC
jgi:hypothetical protein